MNRNRLLAVATVILCCALIVGIGNYGFADTAQAPEVQTDLSAIKEWAGAGWKWLQDTVKAGTEYLQKNLPVWEKTIEQYYAEFSTDPEVQEAWSTLKEGASEVGRISKEKAEEAYDTIRNWMQENGKPINQEIAEAIDQIAIAAGVEEAELAEWHRSAETGSVAKEKVEEAYQALSDWFGSFNTEESEEAEEALEKIVEV